MDTTYTILSLFFVGFAYYNIGLAINLFATAVIIIISVFVIGYKPSFPSRYDWIQRRD